MICQATETLLNQLQLSLREMTQTLMTQIMHLIKMLKLVRRPRTLEKTPIKKLFGGKWILMTCTTFTVLAFCLETTVNTVYIRLKYVLIILVL